MIQVNLKLKMAKKSWISVIILGQEMRIVEDLPNIDLTHAVLLTDPTHLIQDLSHLVGEMIARDTTT